ncbi:mucin-4-like isoform X16 [Anopheles funestus]|uniref:mucin-4-like isoform X16 n=1 Tax=Anopheles funestus TaxID=62324 RepID=UPI0020C62990|nr:mucin-4-like isoform X16 [Anopheles funestus]
MFSLRGAHIYVFPNGNNEKRMKIEVNSNRVTIGAHPLNNIRLHTLNAERLHCKIFADSSNSVTIENYSQKNPIFVNGVCVERRAKLHDNDRFEVAGSAFLWNFDPSHIRVVSKPKKRPNLHSRRKTITLKRIRSTGDITKQSMIKVPRAVGLMLDEYRKRRTIHSTMSAQSLNNIGRNVKNCEEIDLTNQTNAHAESSTQAALDITSSDLSSCITPVIEKENILHSHIKEQKTKLTAQISATKRRHLACHTPVSNLIDLTTPPAKSRITPVVRKPISAKAVQSPRLLDVINIVTPSPNKKGRSTPNSLRAAVATPKRTLLKSAIKNSRANESVGANNTPIPSQSTKKTPNVKLNTLRTNTPKVTPASSKSSSIKIRKHLISTLNEKKGDVLLKPDSPIAIINTGRFSKHSTPTVGKGDRTPKRGNLCVTPKAQRVVQNVIDDHNNEVTNATIEKSAGESCASVLPIIDVQSIIRKPNRTTQIRSARYSDITPHESFADGLLPLATPAEEKEFLLETESTPLPAYMFQDELKSINNMHTNFNPNRNSCSSIVATVSTESSNIRKTMSDFSSSLSGSPLRRFSHKLMQTNIQPDNDWKKDENTNEFESDIDTLAKDADEHGMLASNDLEPPVQKDMVSTPELRHSWRHTRKCIGSAFTSLNTSRPQLDLTAEIDESLVVIEDEEPAPEQKELYNMECSEAFSTTNEQYDLQCPTVKNRATVHMENVPNVSTGPTFESTPDILCSSALEERSAEPSACNTVESTEFPVEHVIEDALEAEDHSAEELLHVDSSEVQSSNILEKGEEMMELMEVMSEAATEQVLDSTSDIFSASALEERSAEPSACSTVESTELPVEHVIEDAPEAEDHSAEELLHVDSSEVQTSNILEKGKEMMEPMEVMSEAATEEVLDSASDVLSASALEERSAEPSACSTVESTELPVKHVIEDAPEAEDHSAEELLHVDSSEVQTSNILEKGKEMMEPMEVMCEAATEQVLDSASDVLSVSALEEGSAEPSACSTVESTEFPVEHVVEDAPEAEDHSAEELLHVDSSEVQSSNILEKGKEMMEPMEVMTEAATEEVLDSTSDVLSVSALEEGSAEPSACSTVESTEFPVEHVIEDAPEAEDHSAEELLHVDSSEVQTSNILEKGKEMMEPMEVMCEAATEQVLDSASDVLSVSALEEGSAEPSACSTVESTEFPVEHVIEDAPEAEDHSAEELLHVDSSEVQSSNILEKGKEMMEPMEVMSEAATEEVLDSASDVLSASALEERSAEPSTCNTVESTEFPVEHVIEDAPEAEDHSAEELLHVDSSEVQSSNILEKGKEMMEPMEVMTEAATEEVLDSTSDVLSASALEERSAEPSACNTVESTEFPVEHVIEDAPEAEDHSAEELLHVDSSEVQTSNILEKGKEMMEPMEIMSEAATEQVLDSTSDILSASALEERSAEPSACNTVESTEFPVEHVIEDAPEAEDHFAEELLHVDSSEVQTSNILEKGKEMMEPMEVMCEAATEQVLDSASDIISASTLEKSGQYPFCHDKDENLHENVGRTGMTESTPKISQRRLYTKKNYSSVTPDNKMNKETPLFISDFDYLGMSETPKSKAKKTNIKTVDCSSIETRKQLPKRVCRGKIHNLSEDFLAGDSPAPKFVKSKVLTEDDQHESNTVTVTDGSSFTDQHFPKQQSKASATRSGRSRKNVLVPVTSNSSGTMEVTDTEPDKILIENNTPVRRGRTRKQVLVSNEDSNKEMDESIKVNENYPSVQTRKTALEGESVSHLGPIDQATGKYVEEKNTSVRRGRPRKQVLVANDMSTKSKDNSVLHSEQIEPLETENNINENETPVRAGRTRKKVLVAEIAKVSKAVEVIDTEQVLHQNVGTKVDKTDTKSEQTEVVVTENQRKVPADKPAAVRRARPRKNAPKTESSILIHPDVTIAKNVTPDEPHPTEDKLDEKTGPVGHPSTDQNLEEKDAPPAVRRGRAHKKVPEVDVTTVVQPVKKGRGKKVIETVEEPIAITENVTPDERHPTEDKLDEKTGPVGHPSTDKNLQEKDAPPAVRRGRAQKKVPEVDVSTVVQPVKKGRGKRVTETVEEPIPITENVTPDERRPTEDKLDDKTGTVGHLSIDKNLEEKDAPPAVRRGRAHKKVPEVDVSTVVQPVKKGRGKKITEMVEESIAITENVTPDERHPTEDKLDEKTGSVGHPSAEKNLEEEDAPPAVRRGRAHKKVPEVDVTTVVQPVKKGRGKKVTETVEEPIAITENVTPDERHPTEDKLDDKTGPVGHPSSDKNLEEKHAPPAVRRGRAHKKVSEVDVSTVVQPVKKGRGKKVTEMAEEKEQDIVTPRKTGRKRKINMQIDPQESEENQKIEDTNEIQPESNRSGGVAQEEDSEKTTEYPNEKKTKKSAAPQAKSKSRKTVKKGDESVSANTSAVKNEAESIDTNVPRRTRAKRN